MGVLDGLVVLVSGSGPGLGRATAAAALREGAGVVLADRQGDVLEQTHAEVDPGGERSVAVRADITSAEDCAAAVAAARDRFGRLDGLVNVAAVDNANGGLDVALDDWDRTAAVNIRGTIQMTRAAVPLIREGGRGGSVVLIGSTMARMPGRTAPRLAYGMSKGALASAVYHLAGELGPDAIRVNNVSPGFKLGPVLDGYFRTEAQRRGVSYDEVADVYRAEVLLPELATDEDVANTAVFFLSGWSKAITGQTVFVDGGDVLP
ncbi:SDR family oxidoreductase [Dactylosporangium sp. CA-092794]|uniref:SDR family oxidoreductase n=1 Tax=Dactylosporangium sp. CA-092794 TaxID=3239929 RepID=UPI003D8A6D11